MLAAGARDRLIGFFPAVVSRNAHGVESETHPAQLEQSWASVLFGSGAERRDAGAAGAQQTATFRVISTPNLRTIDERAQIELDNVRWGITSIAPVGSQGHEIEFTAVRIGAG